MYPTPELNRLAARKAVCRRNIARHRNQCVRATRRIVTPLAALDRLVVLGRRLSPIAAFAAGPLALLLKGSSSPRPSLLASVLQWGATAFGLLRHFRAARPL